VNERIPKHQFDSRELWVMAGFFALVVVFAFPQMVFSNRSLVPSNNYNPLRLQRAFTKADYGPDFIRLKEWTSRGIVPYTNYHDPAGSWLEGEPALIFFRDAVLSGQFPFWDPFVACGSPAYSNPVNEFLFPPQIFLCLLGATSLTKNIYILLLFWTAGFATYCFLRMHAVGTIASAAGGLGFLFSGAVQQVAPSIFMGQPTAMIPVILIATRWFLNLPSWRRTAVTAAIFATAALASFPPILIAAFSFNILYFVSATILEEINRKRKILRFPMAGVLALGLVAIYYIPVLITVSRTTYATKWYRMAARDVLQFGAFFDLLSPTATGGAPGIYAAPIMNLTTWHLFYVGATILLLAGFSFGLVKASARPLLWSCTVCATLLVLKVFGLPPVQWIAYLPILQSIHYAQYFGILLSFVLALLAALGFERLLEARLSVFQMVLSGVTIIAALCVLWLVARHSGGLTLHIAWRWKADYRLVCFFAGAAMVLSAVVCFANRSRKAVWITSWLLLGLVTIEGIVNATYPRQRRWDIFAHPPKYVVVLQHLPRPFRLFVGGALLANLGSAFEIDEFDSLYSFSPPRVYDIYTTYAKPGASSGPLLRMATVLPRDLVLDRAAINYVLVRQNVPAIYRPASRRSYPLFYKDDYVCLFQRRPASRYFFSTEYRLTDQASALKAISTAPAKEIIVESPPPVAASPNTPADPIPEVMSVKLNSLYLRLHSPRPGLLYIADSYYDGWSAKVNGRPSEIYIANYGFRAVAVPAGNVEVRLSYLPVGFTTGACVSVASLVIALLLVTTTRRRSLPEDAGSIA
jgi:hypothetical protein